MSRIETSCTEMDFHSLYARQPITPARTQQSPPPTGQQETTDASVIRTSLQVPQKRAQASTVNNLYSASRKTDAPSASTLSNRLLQTDARIRQLAQRQPDFKPFIATAFRAALDLAFPNVRQPLDPEQIYVTEYVNAVVVLSGDNHVPERRPASSVTLSQALHNALDSGHIPSYNTAQTGFFYAAGNAVNNPAEVVQGMHTSADVITFENILRSTAERSAGDYRHAVQKYWHQTDTHHPAAGSPKILLTSAYREQRQTEAALRAGDATLSSTGKRWLDQICGTEASSDNNPGIFEIALQENSLPTRVSLRGILLVTRSNADRPDTTSGPLLLVAPGQGLMEFASAQQYSDFLLANLRHQDRRAQLLDYADAEHREQAGRIGDLIVQRGAGQAASLRYDAIAGSLPDITIEAWLERQQRDITYAINTRRQNPVAADAALRRAMDLQPAFDSTNISDSRQSLLINTFLKNADAGDITQWRTELQQYQDALKKTQSSGLPSMHQYLDPEFLNTYTSNQIRTQVKRDLGFDIDPDQVIVTTQTYFEHKPPIPNPTTIRKVPFQRSLTTVALANASQLGDADWNEIMVKDADGYTVPRMTHDYLSGMLRTLDIGRRYQELLQAHLLNSPEGKAREQQYVQFMTARLRLDSREAKIHGDISDDGMRWVHATLNRPATILNGQPLLARRLSVNGNILGNILLFGTQAPLLAGQAPRYQPISQAYDMRDTPSSTPFKNTGMAKVILYTPDAPDGKRLREFASREEMKRTFIRNPAMRDYLRQQAKTERQAAVAAGLRSGNVDDHAISGNFLQTSYRLQAQHIIDEADARTTSNAEEDYQIRWERINLTLDIAGIFLPPKIAIPLSLIRAASSFYSAQDAMRNDRSDDAWAAFFEGLAQLSGAALDGVTQDGSRSAAAVTQHFRKPARNAGNIGNGISSDILSAKASTGPSPQTSRSPPSATPAGMNAVQIDGRTYYYWQSTRNTVNYRDLFEPDPAHPGQLKSAGYGAPDAENRWNRISLRGGGGVHGTISSTTGNMMGPPFNAEVAQLIRKHPGPADGVEYFFASVGGQNRRLIYELDANAFTDPPPAGARHYFPRYNEMVALHPLAPRRVTDRQREATLRALGINLRLPLATPAPAPANATPIPRSIHSIWIGGEIPALRREAILASLENNAVMARSGTTPYEMKLYLSNHDPAAYASNLAHLRAGAPSVQVVVLEDTAFYQTFRNSKYFNQYMAALEGNGGVAPNYGSAADILRYRLLHHEGGLYLDCDDTLTAPPGSIEIKTSPHGLALDEPVSNSVLGMEVQYNTSIFGSHKRNPTLDAISEESYRRYLQAPSLYRSPRPRRLSAAQRREAGTDLNTFNEQRLHAYMQKISYVTGPGVFNKVIDERLPEMQQIREAIKLKAHPWNFKLSLPMRTKIEAAAEAALPLGQINRVGNAHTWEESRR